MQFCFLLSTTPYFFHSRSVVDMSAVEIDPSEGFVIELDFGGGDEEGANEE